MKWRETAGREAASRRLTSEFFEELSGGSLKKIQYPPKLGKIMA
jgi:hypothetical protein